ncbi:ComEC/Rec2 family competence protein [Chitinophaga tropicalis]|uniref:Cobyric acid synthase CobQ n=1 Tax=Chitinophaga tropicalis TaxID=2683588 RepID=A0A7K1U6R2_9BACT|nr:cobyric acid synthase CobQ [Chitinophaga tropicalis]MVT10051.1 cobyric acid synthase CobQ [Chitinophaga tropicalis]
MNQVTHFPVGNGDTSLIQTTDSAYTTNIIVDCNIRNESLGSKDPAMYDVKAHLLRSLNRKTVNGITNVPYADVFILTHGDEDHVRGFEQHFYQGDPRLYSQRNKDAGEIINETMWFSPMVMGKANNEDERVFNKEARRRINLHRLNSPDRDLPGNRIAIIGYDGNEKLDGLRHYVPGQIVSRFNNRELSTFSIFIHSPYQQGLTEDEVDKNGVSIVFQARYKINPFSSTFSALFMFAGDANHEAIAEILDKTIRHGNATRHQALAWDVLVAPHHCSWTFFNFCEQEDHPIPEKTSIAFLRQRRTENAHVIASCKPISPYDKNPPHYAAKVEYVKVVGEKNFFNLATAIMRGQTPQPIIYQVTAGGPMKPKAPEGTAKVAGAAGLSTINSIPGYGAGPVQ